LSERAIADIEIGEFSWSRAHFNPAFIIISLDKIAGRPLLRAPFAADRARSFAIFPVPAIYFTKNQNILRSFATQGATYHNAIV